MANKVVIIGGMGPQASLYFHKLIIDNAADTGAQDNEDYPEVVHFSIPVHDFITTDDSRPALNMINDSLSNISVDQDDRVFLTCNTAHILQEEIESHNNLTITPLMGAITKHLSENDYADLNIGVLASPTTIKSGLYASAIEEQRCKIVAPSQSDQKKLEKIIRNVLANKRPESYKKDLRRIIRSLKMQGANKIIIGCTELSVVLKDSRDKSLLDPLKLLVDQNFNSVGQNEEFHFSPSRVVNKISKLLASS